MKIPAVAAAELSRADRRTDGRTDGRTGMMKLTGRFLQYLRERPKYINSTVHMSQSDMTNKSMQKRFSA